MEEDGDEYVQPKVADVDCNIQRQGRSWQDEAMQRYDLCPGKTEMIRGQLFWDEEDRLMMLALLLENVGVDKVIRLGDPNVWREAIAELDSSDR